MSTNRKWLRALALAMMAVGSFAGPMGPREIEELMRTMNQARIELTLPNEDYKDDREWPVPNP
jgi:hypothetical protein